MAKALEESVQTYCTLSTISNEAEAALVEILAGITGAGAGAGAAGEPHGLLQLIASSRDVLASTDDSVRNRGTMLLGEVLTRQPTLVVGLPPGALSTLLTFFANRCADEPCVREVLRGARLVAEEARPDSGPAVHEALVALVKGIFEHVHVQALALADRHNAYQIVHSAVVRLDLGPALLGDNVLMGYVGIMDGERDPRNLRLCFSIITVLARRHLSSSAEAEALFAVFSCYFPITFTPPPNDTVLKFSKVCI
jgi:DNA repair/transcription protein MET18/MMS19